MRFSRSFLIALAAALLLARLGPFDTFGELPPLERYAYWVGLTLLLWLQIELVLHLLRSVEPSAFWHWGVRAVVAGLLAAIPGAFEVAWAESLLRVSRDLGLLDILFIYGDVALIGVALTLLIEWANQAAGAAEAPSAPSPAGKGERLIAALPPDRRGPIIAIAAEDHYLRVYTERGEALILRRFSDAMDDVAVLEGLRVHRSWWVARAAVEGAVREGDRMVLRLKGGLQVPVSRTYQLAVREAGIGSA